MRTLMIAGLAMVTAVAATPATAQRIGAGHQSGGAHGAGGGQWSGGAHGSGGGQWSGGAHGSNGGQWSGGAHPMPPLPGHPRIQPGSHQQRWGGSIGGRWYGGSNAPGGWNAYRRPSRGWILPRYWIAPSFYITDFSNYGLSTPPQGYNWTRYYDDAVLTDGEGRVRDSVSGIDWDSYDQGYGYGDAGPDYADGGPGGYGASYPPPQAYGGSSVTYASRPPAGYYPPPPPQGGYTTTYATSGYASGGFWYPPVTTTTVTVQSAPIVTTTTTEYVETTRYRPVRRVYYAPKRVIRSKLRPRCNCR